MDPTPGRQRAVFSPPRRFFAPSGNKQQSRDTETKSSGPVSLACQGVSRRCASPRGVPPPPLFLSACPSFPAAPRACVLLIFEPRVDGMDQLRPS